MDVASLLGPVVRERARVLAAAVFVVLGFFLAGAPWLGFQPAPATYAADWTLLGLLGLLAIAFAFRAIPERWVHHASLAVLWCPLVATLLTFASTGDQVFVSLVALLIISTGVLLHTPLVAATIVATDAIALPMVARSDHGAMHAATLITATLFALLIHVLMRRALVRAEVHRLAEAAIAQQLAHRLAELERANADRAALEEQLLHAQRMEGIGTLAAGVAHDMNNLLFSITNLASLLLDEVEAPSARADLDAIVEQAGRGAVLTRGLLTFSRRGQYRKQVVVLADLLADLIPLLRRTLPKSITIVEELALGDARVDGDPVHLGQILINLGLNAADAIAADGRLTITGRIVDGTRVRLTVTDNGKGMDAATRARIFDPFFTTKPTGQGTGLGLSTVWGIVHAHGGTIDVESEPGRGAAFHVELPLTAAAPASEAVAPRAAPLTSKGSVLVVDDEPLVRDSTRRQLERLGLSVATAGNGAEGLTALFAIPGQPSVPAFDFVILDMAMPVMGGAECFRAIRKRCDVPVVIATGFAVEQEAQALVASGASLLEKPYTATDLQREVARLLRQGPTAIPGALSA